MSVNIVGLWLPAEGDIEERFAGTGLLLDATHVLTAKHVLKNRANLIVRLVPGVYGDLRADLVTPEHPQYDVALLRFTVNEARGPFQRPVLSRDYVGELRTRGLDMVAVSPDQLFCRIRQHRHWELRRNTS